MVGVISIQVKENLEDLTARLRQAKTLKVKERLQVLYPTFRGSITGYPFILDALSVVNTI